MDLLHNLRLLILNSYKFPPSRNRNRTRNHLSQINSPRLSTHGLHILPHLDRRHHHFLEMVIRFPWSLLSLANCSSLEVMYTAPSLQAMIYMCSQRGISLQLSCEPAERLLAHVPDIPLHSPRLTF